MIDRIFIRSPQYLDYLNNKDNISPNSMVFVEDKEVLITLDKEYQFVPVNGADGQILTKTENGVEFADLEYMSEIDAENLYNEIYN